MGTDRDPGDQKQPTSQPRDPKMQLAKVLLPDGVTKEFEVNKNSEGEALFHQVTRDLSIEEREYFSLCFYCKEEGTRHWLYNDKQISKQIKGLPWEFSFEVKFYPTTPTTIVDDHARYYLFLQLRRDLLTGRLPATADTHALLGSFVAQIEFGDAPAQINDAYEKFIVESKLVPAAYATPERFTSIAELHRLLRGQTTGEVELKFLDHAKHLALYGIHIFKATDKDKKPVDIGVGAAGINIYQDDQKVHTFSWQNIIKIGYKRTYFSVKLKAGTIGKDEKTLYYKLPSYVAAKRAWKCAVEHHTFFRLIQPEDKPQKGLLKFGSQRFRYQGRTQFQTKIASQMFDKPSTVERAPSAMSQPITSAEDQKLQTLNLTDSELEQRQFERYRRALTPKSYTSSRQEDDALSTATFAKYSRPSTMLVVSTSGHHSLHGQQSPQQDLQYSPRDDSSNYSSAAYYLSERSSLRTPSSAYYPPSEYTSPTSPVYYEGQHHGEYHVQMRQTTTTTTSGEGSRSGARRNLFGRSSDVRSSQASRDSVRLVSFHEPVDPNEPIPDTRPVNELPQIPIERIVQVYHEGHYDRLSPRLQQRAELPYGFGNYTPRNGVSHVDNLQPDGEMDEHPIRFFVDLRHSGASRRDETKRLSHPGKEDTKQKIDMKDYEFSSTSSSTDPVPVHRTELGHEIKPANIQQYVHRYHPGDSTQKVEAPKYRLITHVHPLVVSTRDDARSGAQSSSNVTATISQREQVVSTKVRRESPDADRRVRLSASVDRSGNLTDTTEEMARSSTTTSEVTTTTRVITSDIAQSSEVQPKKKKQKKQKIPPSSAQSSSQETRSRFGGFFTKKTSTSKTSEYPETSGQFSGELDTTNRTHEMETAEYAHPQQIPAYSPKKVTTTIVTSSTTSEHHHPEGKKRMMAVDTPEVPKKYRLIARTRHEGDEDVVETSEAYALPSEAHSGPVEEIARQGELQESPLTVHPKVSHYEKAPEVVPLVEKKQKKVKSQKKVVTAVEPQEPEAKEVRLIARVISDSEPEPSVDTAQKPRKEATSSKFGFFSRSPTTIKTSEYPESSDTFAGELGTIDRSQEFESSPFERTQTPVASPVPAISEKNTKKVKSSKKAAPIVEESEKREVRLIARLINEPEPEPETSAEKVQEKKTKKDTSKSKLPSFGFFGSRSNKTAKTTEYPKISDTYTGDLDTTVRTEDNEFSYFEHPEYPEYKPKSEAYQPSEMTHLDESDVVEAPAAYGFPSTSYDGPLETTALERDLEHNTIKEHSDSYHEGFYTTLIPKKSDSPATAGKKSTTQEEEPETTKVRLIARVLPNDPIQSSEPQKSSKRGFFSKKNKTTEGHTGQSESMPRSEDMESSAFERDTSTRIISETDPVVSHEKKRYRLLARFRHEGKEDVVEKPEDYGFAAETYEGPLDDTYRHGELHHAPLSEYVDSPKKIDVPVVETEEPEKKDVRLIARVITERKEDEPIAVTTKERKPKKGKSKLGFFSTTSKTTRTTDYPETSETYSGELVTTPLSDDLEESTFVHPEYPEYIPKNLIVEAIPVKRHSEKKRYRLVARLRHEGEEDVVEKPEGYGFASTSYDGPLDETALQSEMEQSPLEARPKYSESWNYQKPETPIPTLEKKQKKAKPSKKEKIDEPEKKEIRLIAYVKSKPEDEEPVAKTVTEKKSKNESSKFGFFSRSTKTTKTTGYPETSDTFTGELDTTDRTNEMEGAYFEHREYPPYAPKKNVVEPPTPIVPVEPEKKRYRLIARFRHDGDEDVVEKPDAYTFAPEAYDGPLDETHRQAELEQSTLENRPAFSESWNYQKPSPVVEKKEKSPKKVKVEEPGEPETQEVRLIARIKSEPEEEETGVVKEKKPKKESSKFGFFSRSTKAIETVGYPETSGTFTGELDTTDRTNDMEGAYFDHREYPPYAPKKTVVEPPTLTVPAEPEKKRYRLIARFRHDGDEDVVEKPDVYSFAKEAYDGPLDETRRQSELEVSALGNRPAYSESWNYQKPSSPVADKKVKVEEPEEPETKEIRLIARIKSEPEEVETVVVKEKKPKKESSKFGFFSRSTKTNKTVGYPETSGTFTGELDTTDRTNEMEGAYFEHREYPPYAPKKVVVETPVVPEPEKKRYRLIARWRHEGDEDVVENSAETRTRLAAVQQQASVECVPDAVVLRYCSVQNEARLNDAFLMLQCCAPVAQRVNVACLMRGSAEKPDAYSFAPEAYDGPLDETIRKSELEQSILENRPAYSESWNYQKSSSPVVEKKEKSPKKVKAEEPEEPETKEVRLIARVKTGEKDDVAETSDAKAKKSRKEGSKSKLPIFNLFTRSTKTTKRTRYPETSDTFTGELDNTDRTNEMEGAYFEHREYPPYAPKKVVVETPVVPAEPEKKRYRLIARWRHEGDEDVVEKPDAYSFAPEVYDGPLDEIGRQSEIEQSSLEHRPKFFESWNYQKPSSPVVEKKEKSPKKVKAEEPEEPETKEVRLIARIKSETEVEPFTESSSVVKEKKQKKRDSKSKIPTFGFFHRTQEPSTSHFPTSELFTGDLETTGLAHDIERARFEHPEIPAYSPKKIVVEDPVAPGRKKRYHLIARWKHEGDEDIVEKPAGYAFAQDIYDGPLEETVKQSELDQTPLEARPAFFESWNYQRPETPVSTLDKKHKKAVKSPKKEKIPEPEEPETREVRLIARIQSEQEVEPIAHSPVKEKSPKKEGSPSKFGFFSRTTKSTKTTGYPETSESFTGELDITDRIHDAEGTTFEYPEYPAYSPKKTIVDAPEVARTEPEKKRYRLLARWRHEGDEDVIETPNAYAFSPEVYDGPLDETFKQSELDETPLEARPAFFESWNYKKPETPVSTLEKRQKKVKSPKKEKTSVPELPETKEVRLIARIKSEREEDPVAEEVTTNKEKKKGSSSKFGFFSRSTKVTKTDGYPETSETFTGELDTTDRTNEMEGAYFEHQEYPPYAPKKIVVETPTPIVPVEPEKKRYRLIARFRHDGDEDVVEKPDAYSFAPEAYDGPLDETRRQSELELSALENRPDYSESWNYQKPSLPVADKKVKVEEPEEPETKEIRLIARIKSEPEEEETVVVKEKKPKKESSKFGFFSRSTKTAKATDYPGTSDSFTGELDTTDRTNEMEGAYFEHREYPPYAPKEVVVETPVVPAEPEKKRYRLIARWKHEGDEDVVEKPDAYSFSPEAYEGPLDETHRQSELEQSALENRPAYSESWNYQKPSSPVVEKKKSPKKVKVDEPEEPETKEVRLIARIKSEPEEEEVVVVKEKKPKKESSKFGFFSRSTKTTKATDNPGTSDVFDGVLDATNRTDDMQETFFKFPEYPAYSPKKQRSETPEDRSVLVEKKKYRLIARYRHDGEEDVVEKPEFYGFSPEMYGGPLEETALTSDIEHAPIVEYTEVRSHGDLAVEDPVSLKQITPDPVDPETREVRLIARVITQSEDEPILDAAKEKKPKKEGSSSRFGFFSRSTKTTKTVEYPETSDSFTGDLDTTDRTNEMEGAYFEHREYPPYVPKKIVVEVPTPIAPAEPEKKRYRLIARFRHEGDEDVVDKPDLYSFTKEAYDGPLDETIRQSELEQSPLDARPAYSESWNYQKPPPPVAEKKKSPKKVKVEEPEEPEIKEVRLIARIKSEPEEEETVVVKEKKTKKESSKFGFFSRSTKTSKTTGYPETSDAYAGDLETTIISQEVEKSEFHHPEIPAYSPKQIIPEIKVVPSEPEKKRYRLIARFRHEGDEDVVDKPDPYAFSSTLYDGPVEEISRENEIEHSPIADHAEVRPYVEKDEMPKSPVEKKQKKIRSPKKEVLEETDEPEKREIRLIARIKSEPESEESVAGVKEEKPKKESSKFGFFSRSTKTTKTVGYPEASDSFTGELDTTDRTNEMEGAYFEHREYPPYAPKKIVVEAPTPIAPAEPEKKRYRLIARFRHDGDEDVVEKPDAYSFAPEAYEGPLDETHRQSELEQSALENRPAYSESWNYQKPSPVVEKKEKSPMKVKVEEPEEPETKEVRLIARIKSEPEEDEAVVVKEKKSKKESSKLGFFSRSTKTTKTTGYPETSDTFTGELDNTDRTNEMEGAYFEHREYPPYVPKKIVVEAPVVPAEPENKRYRLIARWRHEGDEDVVEKPDAYSFAPEVYDGPLDETIRQSELEQSPLEARPAYSESWNYQKPSSPVVEKKVKVEEPEEPEIKEVRLIARIKSEPEEEETVVVKEKKPKKESSKFGFFSRSTKTTKTSKATDYPGTSDSFTGELDTTDRTNEMEGAYFEHREYPPYAPKKIVIETPVVPAEAEKKRYRLIARWRHEGDEDVVEKPDAYSFAPEVYEGPLDETHRQSELEQSALENRPAYSESWNYQKPSSPVVEKKEKSPKKVKVEEPEEPETKEVRLIARIKSKPEEDEPILDAKKQKKSKNEGSSSKFGFFSRSTKTTKTAGYPETSDSFTGEVDTTDRTNEMEGSFFEHREYPPYVLKQVAVEAPKPIFPAEPEKKRYRLIARFRHDGDEDVVDKPDAYSFAPEAYDGPLDETHRQSELEQSTLENRPDYSESWNSQKPSSPIAEKKEKSQKKVKVDEPEEPETKEVRLIARIKSEPEEDETVVVKEKKPKKESSKFGFFSRSTKTTKTSKATDYPGTSDSFTGELDTTDRTNDMEGSHFEHPEYPPYAPKQIKEEPLETVEPEKEKKRYRLFARWRNDGDEDVGEKSNAYAFPQEVYEGPLDETIRQSEIDHAELVARPLQSDSWNVPKIDKKLKSPKKEKVEDPEDPETKEIRLITYVKSEPENEDAIEQVKEKKPSKLGFFTRSPRSSKSSEIPADPLYEGTLGTTIRSDDFEPVPFEHSEFTTSTPVKVEKITTDTVEEKKPTSRFSWFSRWRHEGEEDVVDKPNAYTLSTDVYDGPLEEIRPSGEVERAPITVVHDGESWGAEKRRQKEKKAKTPEPTTPEPSPEVKLVARVQPMAHEESPESAEKVSVERESPAKERSRAASFNIFHRRQSKLHGYPEITPIFEGHLHETGKAEDVEKTLLEKRTDYPEYSPRKIAPELPVEPPHQGRLHRLIARWRHEGEEDVVEKPDAYKFSSEVYDGPLDDIRPAGEIDHAPINEYSDVHDIGESWNVVIKKSPKTSKKKEITPEPESETENHEVRLVARVKSEDPEDVLSEESTPTKPFRLRFLSLAKKTPESSEYPETSPIYEGPLDLTSRSDEMERMPYLHGAVPPYSPKFTPVKKVEKVEVEKRKLRLISRFRHDGDEDVVEKPEAYNMSSEIYSGELEETGRNQELESVPIAEYADVKNAVAKKTKTTKTKPVRLVARVPPQETEERSDVQIEQRRKEANLLRFFNRSKGTARHSGFPETSPVYEGPLDVTGRAQPIEHVPLERREIPPYSPRKVENTSEDSAPEVPEKKRYRLFARFRHEGNEDVVEKPNAYAFSQDVYEGPLVETVKEGELETVPISEYAVVREYNFGATNSSEESASEQDDDQENLPPRSRFSFLRGQKKQVAKDTLDISSYPSTSYSGPLETTNLNSELEIMPFNIPLHSSLDSRVRKYRLIPRNRHSGEEDEVDHHKLHPVFYSFPITRYNGPLEMTELANEVKRMPLERFTQKYHSGSSSGFLWNLFNRSSKAYKDLDEPEEKQKKDVRLIARVLPMTKTPEKEEKPEKLTKEEQEVHDALAKSAEQMDTSRTLASTLNAINYIPSSLTYDAPRPARIEGFTQDGDCYVEVRHERRAEVQLEPAYVLRETSTSVRSHAYLSTATAYFSGASAAPSSSSAAITAAAGSQDPEAAATTSHSVVVPSFVGSVSEDETGLHHFSWTPLQMSPQPERMSFLARLGFKRDKSKKKDKKKSNKKGENETSGETSDSEHDEKREFAVVEYEPFKHVPSSPQPAQNAPSPPKKPEHRTHKSPGRRADEPMNEVTVVVTSSERPKELKNTKEVRHETREQQFRLTGDGYTSGFNPNDPESGQPYTTVSTWQETSDLPEQVEVYTDENGRQITRTVKSSQVKHTVQTQSFQNYIVDGDQVPVGVVDVERSREQLTPLGQKASSPSGAGAGALVDQNGGDTTTGIVETQTRTMTYEAQGGENAAPPGWAEQGLGEYVSSKSVTQGNRTIETITYKTEKDGVVETHVEHRVTIHSDGDIDHDAELSQAIMEATQMNPDMVVEKIEVRQETTQ
ncbi:CRE-FRM-1 protein [Caenorhabditis remanei]|uniref:CRE-FRM-1 protein n=1 Tax=Caenorhabditis remanei TaxID=31234 RepID=E3M8X8_CAERE|nr:CRE-FRM-1 protein [Caenorhabditis remanei]